MCEEYVTLHDRSWQPDMVMGQSIVLSEIKTEVPLENDGSSQPKGWIHGNTKIGPVLEVTTSCLYGKHGVEIRIWSL